MPTVKVTTAAATKSIGVQTAAKSSESFAINAAKIPHSSSSIVASNVQDALEEVVVKLVQFQTQIAVQTTAPTVSVNEGDLWYDTDDDQLYVRRNSTWTEIVQEDLTGDIDGGTW